MLKGRILVVDDSATIQKVIRIAFSKYPLEVVTAGTPIDAYASMRERKPELLILDASLAGMRSVQDYVRLRDTAGAPMLLLMGSFESVDEQAFAAAGFAHVVKKPFEARDIVEQAYSILGADFFAAIQDGTPGEASPVQASDAEAGAPDADLEFPDAEESVSLPLATSPLPEAPHDAPLPPPPGSSDSAAAPPETAAPVTLGIDLIEPQENMQERIQAEASEEVTPDTAEVSEEPQPAPGGEVSLDLPPLPLMQPEQLGKKAFDETLTAEERTAFGDAPTASRKIEREPTTPLSAPGVAEDTVPPIAGEEVSDSIYDMAPMDQDAVRAAVDEAVQKKLADDSERIVHEAVGEKLAAQFAREFAKLKDKALEQLGQSVEQVEGLKSTLQPQVKTFVEEKAPIIVRESVESYCREHFSSLAREIITNELRRLAEEKSRLLADS